MKTFINNTCYKTKKTKIHTCKKCAALHNYKLCKALPDTCARKIVIWKKVK